MRKIFKTGKRTGRALIAVTMAAAMSVPVIGNALFTDKKLGAEAASYTSGYDSKNAIYEAQHELNRKIVEEGTVLLKNKDKALPLKGNDKKVTVFHSFYNPEDWSQSEGAMVLSGGGSGNIWVNPKDKCEGTEATHGCHTLYNGLAEHEYDYNKALLDVYFEKNAWNEDRPTEFCDVNGPKMDLVKGKESSFTDYNGAAIITISRLETESQDNYEPYMGISDKAFLRDPAQPEKHYLQLRDKEKELIEYAKTQFAKVVVLLNTAAPMEVDYLQTSDSVDAVLWIGYPGESGLKDIPGVLDGTVSPSGRTVDTWVTDMSKDPTWQNFGDNSQNYTDLSAHNTVLDKNGDIYYLDKELAEDPDFVDDGSNSYHSVDYAEGIYLGYRYYETKATVMNEAQAGSGDTWYEENVTYPFGYGLSYTSFTQEIVGTPVTSGDTISFSVKVTNTGDVAGKEVVQVYYNPPYTPGGIEKASANLVAFDKTGLIAAGESETVTVSFDKRDMSSWSLNAGNYVLEDGKYEISLNKDSHNKWETFEYTHSADSEYTEDETTGTAYTKLFSGDDMFNVDKSKYTADGSGVDFMSRATGLELPETAGDVRFSDEAINYLDSQNTYVSTQDKSTDPWVVDAVIPAEWSQAADTSAENVKQLYQMTGIEDDAKWVEFMNQLTWDEMKTLVSSGLYNTAALERIGKPRTNDTDGPAQIGATAGGRGFGWCAAVNISSTWNDDLAEQFGTMVGEEAIHSETNQGTLITGWYGPGMNIHRNPYCGRNFEYYSEDGLLAGKIAAGAVRGAASRGLITYLKHLALNNQETNRTTNGGVCTWTNEQAMREIYLKPFEYAVKEGGATGMMCAFNRIGGVPAGSNYNLFVKLLEDEWGFDGLAVTDYYEGSSWGWPGNMVVRCHMFPMGDYAGERNVARRIDGTWDTEKGRPVVDGEAQDALYYAVRTTAQRMLKAVANSNAVSAKNGLFPDLTYKVVQGLGVGFVNFGSWISESNGDRLWLAEHEDENTSFIIAPGYTFYAPSGNSLGTFTETGTYTTPIKVILGDDKWENLKGETWISNLTFEVLPAFSIDQKTLKGKVDAAFTSQIDFIDYDKEYGIDFDGFTYMSSGIDKGGQWTRAEGLPEGVEILPSGKLSGIPEEAGTFEVTAYYNVKNNNFPFRFTLEIAEKTIVRTEFKTEDGKLWYKHSDQGEDAWQIVIDLSEFKGDKGDAGAAPTISEDGYWVINGEKTEFKVTGDKGENGVTPVITISEDGYWVINGEKTDVKAVGEKGDSGEDGKKGGCNGSVDVVSVAVTSAAFLVTGLAVYAIRRKKKN